MEAVAKLRKCPTSPRKMRLVVDMIRRKGVEEALDLLKFNAKEASRNVEKLLLSAMANWQAKNEGMRLEDSQLYIKEAFVDGAGMLKRWRPAPMGRATRIRKRSNHVTIVVDSRIPQEVAPVEEVKSAEVIPEEKPKEVTPTGKEEKAKAEPKAKTAEAAPKKKEEVAKKPTAAKAKKTSAPKKKSENKNKIDGSKGKSDK